LPVVETEFYMYLRRPDGAPEDGLRRAERFVSGRVRGGAQHSGTGPLEPMARGPLFVDNDGDAPDQRTQQGGGEHGPDTDGG
jgi:hypothetical protein